MMTGLSPFQDLTGGPMDVRLVLVKPGASLDFWMRHSSPSESSYTRIKPCILSHNPWRYAVIKAVSFQPLM